MKKTIIILGVLLFSLFNLSAQEEILNNETINIKVSSPISLSLNKDFNVTPETIVIRTDNDLQIIAGQTIISRYDYENKLDYSVVIKQELNLGTENNNIASYLAQESEIKECLEKNGSLLKYNDQRITVFKNGDQKYLCFLEKNNFYFSEGKLILELEINPGKTTKYLLIVTTPQLAFDLKDNTLVFEDLITINSKQNQKLFDANNQAVNLEEFGPITTSDDNESFLGSLKDIYNNQARRNLNPNFAQADIEINKDLNKSQIKPKENTLKNKMTGFVTFSASKNTWFIIILILLVLIGYTYYKRKKKNNFLKN